MGIFLFEFIPFEFILLFLLFIRIDRNSRPVNTFRQLCVIFHIIYSFIISYYLI